MGQQRVSNITLINSVVNNDMDRIIACVAGVQRGGRGEVECEREARSLGARRERLP